MCQLTHSEVMADVEYPKNMQAIKNGVFFNFGVRKTVSNIDELINTPFWTNLLDKWVYGYDTSEACNVYFKHVVINNRIYEIVYSGKDIIGDGVYLVYTINIIREKDEMVLMPEDYILELGSFECEDFLEEIKNRNLITQEEYDMFTNKNVLTTKTMTKMKSLKWLANRLLEKEKEVEKAAVQYVKDEKMVIENDGIENAFSMFV